MGYWRGLGSVPADDTRDYTFAMPDADAEPVSAPAQLVSSPRLLKTESEVAALSGLPDPEARAALLRTLDYFGSTRLEPRLEPRLDHELDSEGARLSIPMGVGAGAARQEVDPSPRCPSACCSAPPSRASGPSIREVK